ncbi:MAG: hypothetical protein H0T76_26565 [Nannocystis sp.]|nr:hypothetical protein [Nannocystis sp.]MBA3550058.1 hypothetical protein [Nannocystis sp.]
MRWPLLLLALLPISTAIPGIARAGVRVPDDLSEVPGRQLATAPLAWTGHDVLPRAAGKPHILYINFDGAVLRRGCGNDSRHDCSSLADLFSGYVGPFVGTDNRRLAIMQAVRKDLADFGIRAVTTRPPADTDYTMVLYGDLGEQDFAGIAPYIDCGNLWANDTSFAGAFQGSNIGSTIVLQEAAHTWGLEHVNSPFDNLHPFVAQATPRFQDQCNKIVSDTDLVETSGVCNQVHQQFCEVGFQNSYRELLSLFGPAIPDTQPPTLDITSPQDGSFHVLPTTLRLQGEVVDDLTPQIYELTVTNKGETVYAGPVSGLDLALKDPPAGDYDLTVTIRDGAGNAGKDTVRFTLLAEGSEDPDTDTAAATDTDTDGDTGDGGGCRTLAAPPGLLALLLLLPRRRRSPETRGP